LTKSYVKTGGVLCATTYSQYQIFALYTTLVPDLLQVKHKLPKANILLCKYFYQMPLLLFNNSTKAPKQKEINSTDHFTNLLKILEATVLEHRLLETDQQRHRIFLDVLL